MIRKNDNVHPEEGDFVLAFDTCAAYLCVTAGTSDRHSSLVQPGANRSSIDLVPAIQSLLEKEDRRKPDYIIATVGPGSFTGSRIGVSTARNLAMLWDIPVAGFYSLQFYAQSLLSQYDAPFLVSIDGKQSKFYSLLITDSREILSTNEADLQDWTAEQIAAHSRGLPIYCDQPQLLQERIQTQLEIFPLPAPEPKAFFDLIQGAGNLRLHNYEELVPVYVRNDPATARYPGGFQHRSPEKL